MAGGSSGGGGSGALDAAGGDAVQVARHTEEDAVEVLTESVQQEGRLDN